MGARETGVSVTPGADGGSTGDIEWVGVSAVTNASPVPIHSVPAAAWTTVQALLPTEPIRAFTGNGILETTNNRGALEHLALVPTGGSGAYNVYLDNFVLVEHNRLVYSLGTNAPAGLSIDPNTGVLSWAIPPTETPGVYNITVRVTDAGTPPVTASRDFSVTVPPLRIQSTARNGQAVTLTWNAVAGQNYKVQFKTNLSLPWQDLTMVTPGQSTGVFTEPATQQQRFYRIAVGP